MRDKTDGRHEGKMVHIFFFSYQNTLAYMLST